MKPFIIKIAILLLIPLLGSCEKILNVNPTTSLPSEGVIKNTATAAGALRGMYNSLQSADYYGQYLLIWGDLASDDLRHSGTYTTDQEIDANDVLSSNISLEAVWAQLYYSISTANYILKDVPAVKDMDDSIRNQYRGEAFFVRALAYFNLVRSFGKVPIVTTPVTSLNYITLPPRSSVNDVYALIETDLDSAMTLIPPGFSKINTSDANAQATAGAAIALKARVCLFEQKWQAAMDYADIVMESGEFNLANKYADIFDHTKKNNPEIIFEVDFTVLNSNALAFWFFPSDYGGRLEYEPSPDIVAAYDHSDTRYQNNIIEYQTGDDTTIYYSVGKYNDIASGTDNVIVIRYAEMYLIKAEAGLHGATDPGGLTPLDYINEIRQRANVSPLGSVSLAEVLNERRLEFAFEGYRWFDLTRTGSAEAFLPSVTSSDQYLWPVPQQEIDVNPNLKPQNPGY